jgi:hypothetical protein
MDVVGGHKGDFFSPSVIAPCSGPSTFLFGCFWAALLDGGKTRRAVVVRWLASLPLAMANGALTLGLWNGLAGAFDRGSWGPVRGFVGGAIGGATQGIQVWGPALLCTLLFLGLPIGVANWMAKRGLAGEDGGDAIVGFACASLGLFALLPTGNGRPDIPAEAWTRSAAGVLACLLGGAVALAAFARKAQRRALLRDVESGRRDDYRVVTTPEGRCLARVYAEGAGYRIADVEKPICELDEAGRCLRSLASE